MKEDRQDIWDELEDIIYDVETVDEDEYDYQSSGTLYADDIALPFEDFSQAMMTANVIAGNVTSALSGYTTTEYSVSHEELLEAIAKIQDLDDRLKQMNVELDALKFDQPSHDLCM